MYFFQHVELLIDINSISGFPVLKPIMDGYCTWDVMCLTDHSLGTDGATMMYVFEV